MSPSTNITEGRSVLASLRSLVPDRTMRFHEALRIAELQATRLRDLTDAGDEAMPESILADLPRIRIVRRQLPTSGLSYWDGRSWVIAVNRDEPEARQRFTLFHEYKHIIDHGRSDRLYGGTRACLPAQQAEQVADYFAGCVLMPKRFVKRAWGNLIQTPTAIGELFDVSARAAEVRLAQLGLTRDRDRCARPVRSSHAAQHFRIAARRSHA